MLTLCRYAFPNDELLPESNGSRNDRNGWGASAADALSTSLVMEIPYIVNEIISYVPSIDWSVSANHEIVSLFETTIRYMGGFLSGYDLLSGPLASLADNPDNVASLLVQVQNLANNLSFAFDTPTGIPSNNLHIGTQRTDGSDTNGLATIGSLVLEWTRLSDLTGNETYGHLAQRGESYLLNPQPVRQRVYIIYVGSCIDLRCVLKAWAQPWPGLVGTNVNITTGLFEDANGGWNGGDDSFYEYLLKVKAYAIEARNSR